MAIRNSKKISWVYYAKFEHDLMEIPTLYLVYAKRVRGKRKAKWTENKDEASKFTKTELVEPKQIMMEIGMRFMGLERTKKYPWEWGVEDGIVV